MTDKEYYELNGIITGDEIISLKRKKKDIYDYETIPKKRVDEYLSYGWKISKKNKKSIRMKKEKPIDRMLEDEIWYMASLMGFKELNRDRNFKLIISSNPKIPEKQIDVFAKEDDVVLCVECKTGKEMDTKRPLSLIIKEMIFHREDIIKYLHKIYGFEPKLKFAWILATRNLKISEKDQERAKDGNIIIISDDNIDYYLELANHLGLASKYQLLSEVFKRQDIPGLNLMVPAIKGMMGKYVFYSFNIEPSKLLKIAFISHRRKMDKTTLVSYQRMLQKKRLLKIRQYIENDGIFPTSIVINIDSGKKPLRFDCSKACEDTKSKYGILHLPNYYKSAWIIDGQHRLFGFSDSEHAEKVTLPVIAFENLQDSTQAKLFVDINHEQVRVSANLLTDLYSDLFLDSPDEEKNLNAIISIIVRDLRLDIDSPIRNRIIQVGANKKKSKNQPLTINSVFDAIQKSNLIGRVVKGNHFINGPLSEIGPRNNKMNIERSKYIIKEYLNHIKSELPEQWEVGSGPGGYLCTNGGIISLMLVLKSITDHIDKSNVITSCEMSREELIKEIVKYIDPIIEYFKNANAEIYTNYRSRLGLQGHRDNAYSMMLEIHLIIPKFHPLGLDEFIERRSSSVNEDARNITYEIQTTISKHVINTLKEKYKAHDEEWWEVGIPLKIRTLIVQRREEDPERGEYEKYFLLINYKDIVSANWELFKEAFTIDEVGSKEKSLRWIMKLNKIRNKVFHPEKGIATRNEIIFLHDIFEKVKHNKHLMRNI